MSLYASYATNPDLEVKGVVVTYPDLERQEPQAVRVRLARLTGRSAKYKQVQERVMKPYRHMKGSDLPDETRAKAGRTIFIEAAVLSWETKVYEGCIIDPSVPPPDADGWVKGVEVRCDDGKDRILSPTPANLEAALSVAPDFLEMLNGDATSADLYRVERLEADSGN